MDKYAEVEDPNDETDGVPSALGDRSKKKKEEKKGDKEGGKKGAKKTPRKSDKLADQGYVIVKRKPSTIQEAYEDRLKRMEAAEEARVAEEMSKLADDEDPDKNRATLKSSRGRREPRSVKITAIKPCDGTVVCDPKICCKDVRERSSRKPKIEDDETRAELSTIDAGLSEIHLKKIMSRFSVEITPVKEYSAEEKRMILKAKDARPNILEREVCLARKDIRDDIERLKSVGSTPRSRQLPVITEVKVQETPEEIDVVEGAEEGQGDILEDPEGEPLPQNRERERKKTDTDIVDPCSPHKVVVSVFDIVAPSMKTKVKQGLPKAPKLDLTYKMRDAIEEVYPRISAAGTIKVGLLPELRPRSPTPPDTSIEDSAKKRKKKKN